MTDMTIGAPTALQRICEAIDNINSTAYSHSRAFVVEVMGRDCGWLALLAGIACVLRTLSSSGLSTDVSIIFAGVVQISSSSLKGRQQAMSGRTRCVTRLNM